MSKIKKIKAWEILNSRGQPTVKVALETKEGVFTAAAAKGISAGQHEALDLRDGGSRYGGQGVRRAVANINEIIAPRLAGQKVSSQEEIDRLLLELDGTPNKSKLGVNAILPVSLAVCRAAAAARQMPLYRYFAWLRGKKEVSLPEPLILILEGGRHGNWSTDIQEFMVVPRRGAFSSFSQKLEAGERIFRAMEEILVGRKYATGVGAEGAFCPPQITTNEEALSLLTEAVAKAGFSLSEEIGLAVDIAASEFFQEGEYRLVTSGENFSSAAWQERVAAWAEKYSLELLEDVCDEEDWDGWVSLTKRLGQKRKIIGDDLLTTNPERIKKAIGLAAVNGAIVKPNQIGTLSETLAAIDLIEKAGWVWIVSHRGGETNDSFLADLAVGSESRYCKFGAPNRGERIAKYNRLLEIENEINGQL